MALVIPVRGNTPEIHDSCWMAPNASIIGDVLLSEDCTVWFNAVIRGDVCRIEIGKKCNIQDGVIIHGTYNKSKTILEENVSVGHGAVLHGCHIKSNVLVGMKAVIMDNTIVESNVIVAAGAVVLENQTLESGYIYAGVPAKKVKKIDAEASQFHIARTADAYLLYSSWFQEGGE
ncbi:MAG: carbonic anhydrase/acetyltransferase-like protein (isoleucine patch superfamily) [Saprospiraceae bacterium]|jgi:carbonic anhydrase/acetyltransferase-like protein (isoleucine patch superfamily)